MLEEVFLQTSDCAFILAAGKLTYIRLAKQFFKEFRNTDSLIIVVRIIAHLAQKLLKPIQRSDLTDNILRSLFQKDDGIQPSLGIGANSGGTTEKMAVHLYTIIQRRNQSTIAINNRPVRVSCP